MPFLCAAPRIRAVSGRADRATVKAVPDVDNATIVVWPPNHEELVSAFVNWAGSESDLRVFFTPDVLIGFDTPTRRGYLFDDGWTVEVWIERGLPAYLDLLPAEYLCEHCEIERLPSDPSPRQGMLELALTKGAPINQVRDLM